MKCLKMFSPVRWYEKQRMGMRILLAFMLVTGAAAAAGAFSTWIISDVSDRAGAMYGRNLIPMSNISTLINSYQSCQYQVRDLVIERAPYVQQEILEKLKKNDTLVDSSLISMSRHLDSPPLQKLHRQILEDLKLYRSFRDKVVELSMTGRTDEAMNTLRNVATEPAERIEVSLQDMKKEYERQAAIRDAANSGMARMAFWINVVLALGAAITAVSAATYLARGLSRRIGNLQQAVESLATGDLTARAAAIDAGPTKDELVHLTHAFNTMGERFQETVSRLSESSVQLARSAEQLNREAAQIAEGTAEAANEIVAVSTATEQMSIGANDIAETCVAVAGDVRQANDEVARGNTVITASVEAIHRIADQVSTTARLMAALGERSNHIGAIVGTIEEIADQTNLLALNAAIEAARAGDMGRGFAVVADEVRSLAEKTTSATKEISKTIKGVQVETRSAVEGMENGVAHAEEGTAAAERSGEALRSILENMAAVTVQVERIAGTIEEQNAATRNIAENVVRVNSLIGKAADGAKRSADEATALTGLANDLQRLVMGFRIA